MAHSARQRMCGLTYKRPPRHRRACQARAALRMCRVSRRQTRTCRTRGRPRSGRADLRGQQSRTAGLLRCCTGGSVPHTDPSKVASPLHPKTQRIRRVRLWEAPRRRTVCSTSTACPLATLGRRLPNRSRLGRILRTRIPEHSHARIIRPPPRRLQTADHRGHRARRRDGRMRSPWHRNTRAQRPSRAQRDRVATLRVAHRARLGGV